MYVSAIELSLIDLEDDAFLIRNNDYSPQLLNSINELGLLNPPILRKTNDRYQIITGWKRILSCIDLGFSEIVCNIYDATDYDCLRVIYNDNKDNFLDLELGELIYLFKDLCSLDDKELITNILPLLEIPPNRKNLDRYLGLSSLHNSIKDAYYQEKITLEQCHMLGELSPENQPSMLNTLLLKYKLNNNESRQVMQIVEEIALRDLKSISEVISEAEDNAEIKEISKNELRQELRKMRYPDLFEVENRYKAAIKQLKLPKEINLYVNQFFEANDLEFRIKVRSLEELSELMDYLSQKLDSGELEKLLKVVKYGLK